jgi:hypothetical protein
MHIPQHVAKDVSEAVDWALEVNGLREVNAKDEGVQVRVLTSANITGDVSKAVTRALAASVPEEDSMKGKGVTVRVKVEEKEREVKEGQPALVEMTITVDKGGKNKRY